jgi:hypothetical protein
MSGTVVTTVAGSPVAGANLATSVGAVMADAGGRFTLSRTSAPSGAISATISADGYRTRETHRAAARSEDAGVDLIATGPPFDEGFFNEFARDTFEHPEIVRQLYPWSEQPRFYVRSVDETGRPIPPEVVREVRTGIVEGVPAFTGGRYSAVIEEGTATRSEAVGWINVDVVKVIPAGDYCGFSTDIGGNPSTILLRLERCGCGSIKIPKGVVLHEVGHALGFFHVSDRSHLMYPLAATGCPAESPSPKERHHAAIVYSRPRGNLDPDRDPAIFLLARSGGRQPGASGRP